MILSPSSVKVRVAQGFNFKFNEEPPRELGDIPDRDRILPTELMVYSSGDLSDWQTVFRRHREREAVEEELPDLGELRIEEEQPPNQIELSTGDEPVGSESDESLDFGIGRIFLAHSDHLKLALLAALLDHQFRKSQGKPINQAYEEMLEEVSVRLVSFSIQLRLNNVALSPARQRIISRLYDLATLPLQTWQEQLWVYDLEQINVDGLSTLVRLVDNPASDPFPFFRFLVDMYENQILSQVNLVVEYQPPGKSERDRRILMTDQLSDGEFAFLSRMALIYLLDEDECLFLLDEPEVHFNDDWKRNLVDSIERALGDKHSEVILVSHTVITLTDAFPNEVILLGTTGQKTVPRTLGAEPGELLQSIFKADQTVGKRAQRKIDVALEKGDKAELEELLKQVGPGYYRFTIVEEIQRVSSDQQD